MKNLDNSTAHLSEVYDTQINSTIPYHNCFHSETINFIKAVKNNPSVWLDTGCGTGSLVEKASTIFKDTVFILADPSEGMLNKAKIKFENTCGSNIKILSPVSSQDIKLDSNLKPDIITAIQAHHYLSIEERIKAKRNCYNLLNENGIFITFENISSTTKKGIEIGKEYWKSFQITSGKDSIAAENHIKRFGVEYFPITVQEHLCLLKNCGFKVVELFWYSYMQAGFYCIK